MNKYKIYIKTEKELLSDLGDTWRYSVGVNFPPHMDYLLGREMVDIEYIIEQLPRFYVRDGKIDTSKLFRFSIRRPDSDYTWTLTSRLIKQVLVAPTYNEKRKLIYE